MDDETTLLEQQMGYLLVLCLVSNQYILGTPLLTPPPMRYASVYVKSSTLHNFPPKGPANSVMCYVMPPGHPLLKETEEWLKLMPDLEPLKHGRIYAYLR